MAEAVTVLTKIAEPELLRKLMKVPGDQNPLSCLQCGKCTSGCTIMVLLENYPHRVVDRVRLGLIDDLLRSDVIWACTQCLKCKEACPQKVSPMEVFLALRSLAISSGASLPEAYMKMLANTIETGFVQEPVEAIGKDGKSYKREDLGLPPICGPRNLEVFQLTVMKAFEKSP